MPKTLHTSLHRTLMIWVILAILISSGCSPQQPAAESQPGAPTAAAEAPAGQDGEQSGGEQSGGEQSGGEQSGGEQPESEQPDAGQPGDEQPGDEEADMDVNELEVIFEDDYQPEPLASEPLGSITFTADETSAVERELSPEDGDVELQVVDGAGQTWTLSIPAGAMDGLATVRMIPLSELDGSALGEGAGAVTGGVRLEPDGLAFRKPARLSVSGPGLDGVTLILAGDHEGAQVDYTLQEVETSDPTANVLHFSTYFASPLPDPRIAEMNRQAMQQYNELAKLAKQMRRAPLRIPTPPSIPLDCPDEQTTQALEQYVKKALEPETELAGKMLKQWRIVALTAEDTVEGVPDLVLGLILRLVRKANVLIDQYYGSEDKLLAVTTFALQAGRMASLLGGDQADIQQIIANLASWNHGLVDKLVDEIGKKHNYKRIPTAVQVAYHAAILGAPGVGSEFLDQLREVLRFEITVRYTMEDPEIKARNVSEVVIPLQFEPAYGWIYRCFGQGTGKPLEAVVDEEGWSISANAYPVKLGVTDFDPCKGTINLRIDRFGSDADTAAFEGYSGPWNVSQLSAESLFEAETRDGYFEFTLPVQNGDASMVDYTLPRTRDDGILTGTLEVKIVHK